MPNKTLFAPLELSNALLSECDTYRYLLTRTWGAGNRLCWIMLNPSTADAHNDDPTIRRCVRFAKDWGFGSISVVNLFALRATDPSELPKHDDPFGRGNNVAILSAAMHCHRVVAAWGVHGELYGRDVEVLALLAHHGIGVCCLDTTKAGHPRHPLFMPADAELTTYPQEFRDA